VPYLVFIYFGLLSSFSFLFPGIGTLLEKNLCFCYAHPLGLFVCSYSTSFGRQTFGRNTVGRQTFGRKPFGRQTFGQNTVDRRTFGRQTFFPKYS